MKIALVYAAATCRRLVDMVYGQELACRCRTRACAELSGGDAPTRGPSDWLSAPSARSPRRAEIALWTARAAMARRSLAQPHREPRELAADGLEWHRRAACWPPTPPAGALQAPASCAAIASSADAHRVPTRTGREHVAARAGAAASLVVLQARALVHRQAARRAARGARESSRRPPWQRVVSAPSRLAMRRISGAVKRRGSRPLTITAVEVAAELRRASPSLQLERLGDRHLARLSDTAEVGGARRVREQLADLAAAWPATGPTRAIAPNVCGEREHRQRMPGRRRVEHDQVIAAAAPLPAPRLRQLARS